MQVFFPFFVVSDSIRQAPQSRRFLVVALHSMIDSSFVPTISRCYFRPLSRMGCGLCCGFILCISVAFLPPLKGFVHFKNLLDQLDHLDQVRTWLVNFANLVICFFYMAILTILAISPFPPLSPDQIFLPLLPFLPHLFLIVSAMIG